ncbi:Fc.00g031220.m01.CDS01 [Cosmosporella sp. VM-42]
MPTRALKPLRLADLHSSKINPTSSLKMGLFSTDSLRGPGMIILQALRVFTIIGLAAAVTACWTLIIKIDTSNGFFFFDAASLFFTSTISVFLAISELPLARSYFRRTWPILSEESGFTWLGLAMILIGCNILGKLNQPHNSPDEIGLPFWRLVLASGILSITFGLVNIICSFIFRDGANGINARNVRSEGSLAKSTKGSFPSNDDYSVRSNSLRNEKTKSKFRSMFWKKESGGKPSEKPSISAPIQTHNAHYDVERDAGSDDDWDRDHDRRSPIVPELKRPDTALHPMHAPRTARSSYYSEAHMSRF